MLAETVCSAVAAAGLGIAAITAYRKRFLSAARIAAYALVPLGLVMTGAVQWLADTAFSPMAWAGFGVLGVAWMLFMTTRAVERRRTGEAGKGVPGKERKAAAEPSASGPALGRGQRGAAAKPPAAADGEDFSDIEAILKKHGL
ncbi:MULTISPECIES: hypothetical protein [Streptomyces]|uniref:Integral membrane protein n=1 Tax=Streptomyces solicathayae TaxID=3081768 RepID=A0ABZ0M1B6_9ACTN|nr:hypothetical protein [Streptomyces sp. HUAS YS2]WOX25458.1 hypothetical protein R2D22_30410 [Streptomyces sp. HUAS YS2]